MIRYEWTGADGQHLYAVRRADGVLDTNSGGLEAQEELLRVVGVWSRACAERDVLREEKEGALQAARTAMGSLQIVGRENDLLRAGPTAVQILQHSSLRRQLEQWQAEAARRSKAHFELHDRYRRKRKKLRKAKKRIAELEELARKERYG